MISPAQSKTNDTICGSEEHIHSEKCFAAPENGLSILTCSSIDSSEKIAHSHNELCYDQNGNIICPLEEISHIHDDSCLNENGTISCGYIFHSHDENCFEVPDDPENASFLVCGQEVHVHKSDCYEFAAEKMSDDKDDVSPELLKLTYSDISIMSDNDDNEIQDVPTFYANDIALDKYISLNEKVSGSDTEYKYIESIKLKYSTDNDNWPEVTGAPGEVLQGDATYRLEIEYKDITIADLKANDNRMVLDGIPEWIKPGADGQVPYNNAPAGSIHVQDGKLIVTFYDSFINGKADSTVLSGDLFVQGDFDWTKIENSTDKIKLPNLDISINFEDDLDKKYGKIRADKHAPELVESSTKDQYCLKYTIDVYNLDDGDIPDIYVIDTLGEGSSFVKGYCGITNTSKTLSSSENGFEPCEKIVCSENSDPRGTVKLQSSDSMIWDIGTLHAGEKRTLTYYVLLDKYYTGASERGSISNSIQAFADTVLKDEDAAVFTPTAGLIIYKYCIENDLNECGTGTLKYRIRIESPENNTYPIINFRVNDYFFSPYNKFIDYRNDFNITSSKGYDITGVTSTIDNTNGSFDLTIPCIHPNEDIFIEYTVDVEDIYILTNDSIDVLNRARAFSEKNNNRGSASDAIFSGYTNHFMSTPRKWMRKVYGGSVNERTVTMPASDPRLYYSHSPSSVTSFNVPDNSLIYNIVINENGAWDLSGAVMKDAFTDSFALLHLEYCGYLQVRQYERSDLITESTEDGDAADILAGLTPVKTVWLDIDGRKEFEFTPESIGFPDDRKYVYLLTYYARTYDMSSTGMVSIENQFRIEGTIGNGTRPVKYYPGIYVSLSSAISGDINYTAKKSFVKFEKDPEDNGKGTIYWSVKVNGNIPEGLALRDTADNFSTLGENSIVGAFKASNNLDLSSFTTYDEFTAKNQTEPIAGGEFKVDQYMIENIDDLDGKSFILRNYVDNNYYYVTNFVMQQDKTYSGLKHVSASTVKWLFEKVPNTTNDFYISTIINGEKKYLSLINRNDNEAFSYLSETPYTFTVDFVSNNANHEIKIYNSSKLHLTRYNKVYCAYVRSLDSSLPASSFQLCTASSEIGDYYISDQDNKHIEVTFSQAMNIPKKDALYFIIKTDVNLPTRKTDDDRVITNSLETSESSSSGWVPANTAQYTYKTGHAIMKEGKGAYVYDGKNFDVDNTYTKLIVKNWLKGPGTYTNWLINVNWDSSLNGTVDITDQLPEGLEPAYLMLYYWRRGQTTPPEYMRIPELEASGQWIKYQTTFYIVPGGSGSETGNVENMRTIPYYYNPMTHQIKWRIANIDYVPEDEGIYGKRELNFQLVCKVTDTEALISPTGKDIQNTVYVSCNNSISSDSDIIHVQRKNILKKSFNDPAMNEVDNGSDKQYNFSTMNIPYKLEINPNGENIGKDGVLPPLIDEISGKDGMEFVYVENTIRVVDGSGNVVKGYTYNITSRTEGGNYIQTLTFNNLPSNKKLTITYEVRTAKTVNANQSLNLSNKAFWEGYAPSEDSQLNDKNVTVTLYGTVNLAEKPTIKVIKTDKGNSSMRLSGAQFEIYDTAGQLITTGSTNASGELIFDNTNLSYDTVYNIKEKKAPSGYICDTSDHYLVVIKDSTDSYDAYPDIFKWYAAVNGATCEFYMKNSRITISVDKEFKDKDGVAMPPVPGKYYFGIYSSDPQTNPGAKPLQTLTIEYPEDGEPVYTLDGVKKSAPQFTCAGDKSLYYVYELSADKKPVSNHISFVIGETVFESIYTSGFDDFPNAVSASSPVITITNQVRVFIMPTSGGSGTGKFIIAGISIMVLSALFIILKKKK